MYARPGMCEFELVRVRLPTRECVSVCMCVCVCDSGYSAFRLCLCALITWRVSAVASTDKETRLSEFVERFSLPINDCRAGACSELRRSLRVFAA